MNTWKGQHIAFRLKWTLAIFVEIVATVAMFLKYATFEQWLFAQSVLLAAIGADMGMKIKKMLNGRKTGKNDK